METGSNSQAQFNPGQPNRKPASPTSSQFDTVGNRFIYLTEEVNQAENVSMFPCDIRDALTQAMNLAERGFVDAKVTMPNGRKIAAAKVVRMFGLNKYTSKI